jgi:hypothetical protein
LTVNETITGFLLESQRFCQFVATLLAAGEFNESVRTALDREASVLALRIEAGASLVD